ncbi:MAG TPA: alpha/beta fold hydrolase [Chloroflexota bacterium]
MSAQDLVLVHETHPARRGDQPHPGLLLLHGRGADERDLLPLASELDDRLFTVSARAPFAMPWGGYAWYDLGSQGIGFPSAETIGHSLQLLDRFLDEIIQTYPIDPRRLYVGGFSMGAATSAALALLYPERIAGAVILSGYVPLEAELPFRPQEAAGHPVFEAHGTMDQVIPVDWARRSRQHLESTPLHFTYREYPMGHEISYPELQDVSAWLTGVLDSSHPADRGVAGSEPAPAP